jgi:ssDNA-specific exonuclease RecJ
MTEELEKMFAALSRVSEKQGLLWLMSAGLKHELRDASGYKSNVETAKPDTLFDVPIETMIRPHAKWRLVRVLQ